MNRPARAVVAAAVCVAGVAFASAFAASAVPPPPERWVTDQAGFLSGGTRGALDEKLEAYERQTGHQVLVWIGHSTGGVPIEEWAARAFERWRVGRKGLDDGVVLFVFADDRRMRIEVGYGLEDKLPDAVASRIISEILTPEFRAGERDRGVSRAVDAILGSIEGKAVSPGSPAPVRIPIPNTAELVLIALALIGFLILLIVNPSLAMTLLFFMRRGGGRGGKNGGGFRGGGGRSGGGGASGSW